MSYIGRVPTAVPLAVNDIPDLPTSKITSGTSGKLKVKLNDGTDNVELFEIDISSNAITSNMSVTGTITEADPNAIPFAVALGS